MTYESDLLKNTVRPGEMILLSEIFSSKDQTLSDKQSNP
jgi:hypothetical protein